MGTRANSDRRDLESFDLRTDPLADLLARWPEASGSPLAAIVCSSICQIDRCYRERESSYHVNVVQTKKLLADLAKRGADVVFLSTSHVFDGREGSYDEVSPRRPLSEYGRQKAAVEDFLLQSDPKSLVLRLDKVVGDDPAESHLFSEWHSLRKAGRPIRCIEGQVLSPTAVDDVARAVCLAAEKKLSGLYHVANPETFSRTALAELYCSLADVPPDVQSVPQEDFDFADDRPLKTNLDTRRFVEATGFSFTPMQTVIETFLEKMAGEETPP